MSRPAFAAAIVIAAVFPTFAWSQAADPTLNQRTANPTSDLGTSNPSASGTAANPTLGTNRGAMDAQQTSPEGQQVQASPGGTTSDMDDATADDWRMVMHNGRWWYWTPNNSWLYRSGDRWMAYIPRNGPQYSGSAAVDRTQRYQAGYRGAIQVQGDTRQQGGTGQALGNTQPDPRTGQPTTLSTNANTPGFEATRPIAPTASELQGFYQQQGLRATPYGGTTGGARNATPLGGGATRSGTGATGPATFGTPQTNMPGASPITSSPGNPGAIGSPGNPAASGAAGTGAGGTTPAGGAGGTSGTSGAGGAGASGGTGASGS